MIILEVDAKQAFDRTDTGMPYYNDFLDPDELDYLQREKNRTGEIVMMSPAEYYKICATKIFKGNAADHDVQDLIDSRKISSNLSKYIQMFRDGVSFHMPMLNFAENGQEGLHRMLAAAEVFGWDTKFPVLVVKPYDDEVEARRKAYRKMYDYLDWSFKGDVEDTGIWVHERYMFADEMPKDILVIIKNHIERLSKCKLDVRVTIGKDGYDNWVFIVTPIKYDGLEINNPKSREHTIWVEDTFDIPEDFDIDDYEIAEAVQS